MRQATFPRDGARTAVLVAVVSLCTAVSPAVAGAQHTISGLVTSTAGNPIAGASIEIPDGARRAVSNSAGRYSLSGVTCTHCRLVFRAIGYVAKEIPDVALTDSLARVDAVLEIAPLRLTDIVVSPGQVSVATDHVVSTAVLTQRDIEALPRIGDDMYRALARLPGIASNEYSARFRLHNSPNEDVLVRLDGVELYEPFHLKDYDGSLSLVDADAISQVTLSKGGFSVDQGNHLAGVLDMRSRDGGDTRGSTSVSLSLSGMRASSGGTFASNRGSWRASARRGYLDILLGMIEGGNEISPAYHDVLASVKYAFTPSHSASLHVLDAADVTHAGSAGDPTLDSKYHNDYVWSVWNADWSENLKSETVASFAALTWFRRGANLAGDPPFAVHDDRSLHDVSVRQDWTFSLNARNAIRWGAAVQQLSSDYDYTRSGRLNGERVETVDVSLAPTGTALALYGSYRARPIDAMTLEAGVRYDRHSYTSDETISPRVSVAVAASARTTIRASVGRYAQAQGLHQLAVQDGDTAFSPSETALHTTLGVEHKLGKRTALTVDAYDRRESNRRPRYVNITAYLERFPEAMTDRIRLDAPQGDARGIDIALRGGRGDWLTWSGSYSLARATDEVADHDISRVFEQRHTLYLDAAFTPSSAWQFGIGWQLHSGWPSTTPVYTMRQTGPNSVTIARSFPRLADASLPLYHRLDVRASRRFHVGGSNLVVYADIFNAYDRKNVNGYDYSFQVQQGQLIVTPTRSTMLPILPSVGLTWQF